MLHLEELLKSELNGLDPAARKFAQTVCYTYLWGTLPETRKEYQGRRKRLRHTSKQSMQLAIELRSLLDKIQKLSDDVRVAHTPRFASVPILGLAGLAGPVEYFRIHSRRDPSAPLNTCRESLAATESFLIRESKFLEDKARKTKPLWKVKVEFGWQKGAFQYVLERLFRERARLTIEQAHLRIIGIRLKLIAKNKRLKFDEEKRCSTAIRNAIDRLPPAYKQQCDRVLSSALKLPLPRKH